MQNKDSEKKEKLSSTQEETTPKTKGKIQKSDTTTKAKEQKKREDVLKSETQVVAEEVSPKKKRTSKKKDDISVKKDTSKEKTTQEKTVQNINDETIKEDASKKINDVSAKEDAEKKKTTKAKTAKEKNDVSPIDDSSKAKTAKEIENANTKEDTAIEKTTKEIEDVSSKKDTAKKKTTKAKSKKASQEIEDVSAIEKTDKKSKEDIAQEVKAKPVRKSRKKIEKAKKDDSKPDNSHDYENDFVQSIVFLDSDDDKEDKKKDSQEKEEKDVPDFSEIDLEKEFENLTKRMEKIFKSDTHNIFNDVSDMLPKEVPLFPLDGRPVIPGLMFPIFIRFDPFIQKFVQYLEKNNEIYIGFIYTRPLLKEKGVERGKDKELNGDSLFPFLGGEQDKLRIPVHKFPKVGVLAQVLKVMQMPTGDYHVLIRGIRRFKIKEMHRNDTFWKARIFYPTLDDSGDKEDRKVYIDSITETMRKISESAPYLPDELKSIIAHLNISDPDRLCDFALMVSLSQPKEIQESLECFHIDTRLQKTLLLLKKEYDYLKVREKINKQIEEKIQQRQKDYFLREQLKAIKKELGDEQDEKTVEMNRLQKSIEGKTLSEEAQKKFKEEMEKLSLLDINSPEFGITRNYLACLVSLPWGIQSKDNLDIEEARKILDEDHYGLEDVKDRLIEFLAVGKLLERVEGSILCFVGPPGVGKTSLGKSIARALNRKFFRFSVGGMHDEAEIKGHRRTYIGSMPGKLIQALRTVETDNPVIMLDEIDKIGKDYRGDPSSALLEALDPEQNNAFLDHYLDVPYDLSKILFILTANILDTIPSPLKDRMEIIHLSGYIKQEKIAIAQRHLIPKQEKRHGLDNTKIIFTTKAIDTIIDLYARESGVRGLEKQLMKIMRKTAVMLLKEKKKSVRVLTNNIEKFLGPPIFKESPLDKAETPGITTGLAWTALGGSVLNIESVAKIAKPFLFKQTGQLGDVMVESSNIAYSYVMANAKLFNIAENYFQQRQVHLHVPAGATPKDGPSAGITMATSLVSLAKNIRLNKNIAMTGELTLTGRVLPVGGIREKLIAAKRAKITTVILPSENQRDIKEIPKHITDGLNIHFVKTYPEVYNLCFAETNYKEDTPE
ncbi:MAG: endopeptidase La [Planctomycetes bacterium]|nr:endopeptidase La [Planctomycetota bacterium]